MRRQGLELRNRPRVGWYVAHKFFTESPRVTIVVVVIYEISAAEEYNLQSSGAHNIAVMRLNG